MRPSLLTWLSTSLSAGLASRGAFLLSYHSCAKHVWHRFFGCLTLLCAAVHALSLSLSSSSVVCSRSYLRLRSGLHHASGDSELLDVGLRYVLNLAANRLGHLCSSLHLWSHRNFLRDLVLTLKLFDITSTRSFQSVRSMCKFRSFSHKNHSLLVQLSVSVCIHKLYQNLAGDRIDPNSLFHDLAVRVDRVVEAVQQHDHPRPRLAYRSRP